MGKGWPAGSGDTEWASHLESGLVNKQDGAFSLHVRQRMLVLSAAFFFPVMSCVLSSCNLPKYHNYSYTSIPTCRCSFILLRRVRLLRGSQHHMERPLPRFDAQRRPSSIRTLWMACWGPGCGALPACPPPHEKQPPRNICVNAKTVFTYESLPFFYYVQQCYYVIINIFIMAV